MGYNEYQQARAERILEAQGEIVKGLPSALRANREKISGDIAESLMSRLNGPNSPYRPEKVLARGADTSTSSPATRRRVSGVMARMVGQGAATPEQSYIRRRVAASNSGRVAGSYPSSSQARGILIEAGQITRPRP